MPIVKLSKDFVEHHLHCPEGKRRIEYVHDDRSGLYVLVSATHPGQGTYYLRFKDASGKTCHHKIGRTSDIDLDDAKQQVKELRAAIALGDDPHAEAKAKKAIPTFTIFFEESYLPLIKTRKRTWKKDREMFNVRLKDAFGSAKLTQITRQQIQQLHTSIKDEGLAGATADHYLKLTRQVLSHAADYGIIDKNPAVGIKQFNEDNRRERYLNAEELRKLMEVLQTDENRPVCLAVQFLLATGARLNEALSATWDQVDKENRVWRIPASVSKSKRVRSVPLNDAALAVMEQLSEDHDRLFVSKKSGEPLKYVHKVWNRLRCKAGLPDLRLHDLRHSYASMLVNAGRSLYEVQQILGHSDSKVTARYSHLSSKSLQEAADSASRAITNALAKWSSVGS